MSSIILNYLEYEMLFYYKIFLFFDEKGKTCLCRILV